MANKSLVRPRTRARAWMCLATVTLVVSLASCGRGGDADLSEVVEADSAEAGKTIRSDEWAATLVSAPQLAKMVGSGPEIDRSLVGDVATDNSAPAGGRQGSLAAEGTWLVLALEITNETGDLAMLSKRLLKVVDAQGTDYPVADAMPHFLLIDGDERWTSIQDNQLIEYVFEAGLPRGGPMVYDLPESAAGLKLVMDGAEETIDLGF